MKKDTTKYAFESLNHIIALKGQESQSQSHLNRISITIASQSQSHRNCISTDLACSSKYSAISKVYFALCLSCSATPSCASTNKIFI